ncbi:hypothetical protein B7C42_08146 [Nocardia cerradoensis]|uniref:HNH nuclease domain-containing protein n=1 Tax=Nocardia cerradoensis TaxID=85688 RepID=A0A231GTH7_9NOCA|nr:HNH endonuclease [Nocardia cerradoensis]OXR39781.1 hypothetical protein B7C42_08146 [Nocardia cerradoensis]
MDTTFEQALREAMFRHLDELVRETGVVTRDQLWDFIVDGKVHRLIDRNRGIRNPADMNATLSILSDPKSSYSDEEVGESLFAYAYREGSINGDNRKLRRAYELDLPLILLRKIEDGLFVPVYPVYVVADDQEKRQFLIALDESLRRLPHPTHPDEIERRYIERVTKQRLHQPEFRARVLNAYKYQCTICNLKLGELLDAAHIIADGKPDGTPTIDNGLSMCKIHHAAYDSNFLGISPDYEVRINQKLMDDEDGPMLRHGLQEMNGRKLFVPSRRQHKPSRDRLAVRYDEFKAAS